MNARQTHDYDAILAELLSGKSQNRAAATLGVSRSTVERVARMYRDEFPIISEKKANRVPPPGIVAIPAWVRNADLISDYADVARLSDEHVAARHCRRLLTESRRLSSITERLGADRGREA